MTTTQPTPMPDLPPLPPIPPGGPIPGTSTTGGPSVAPDPAGLLFDRADLDDTAPRTLPPGVEGWAVDGGVDLLCGHLPGEPHDDECEYWRMVALGELPDPIAPVIVLPAFDLRRLAAERITAVEWDRRERGAA